MVTLCSAFASFEFYFPSLTYGMSGGNKVPTEVMACLNMYSLNVCWQREDNLVLRKKSQKLSP